jgi:hypothetical protein
MEQFIAGSSAKMEEFFEHSEEKAHVGYYVSKL